MNTRILLSTLLLLSSFAVHSEIPDVNDFRVVPQFPQPAENAFGVTGTATPDGRFVFWDGETVYLQPESGSHKLDAIATGYIGDPGFLAVSPDGHTLLLGAGFTPTLYLLDLDAPVDFAEGTEIAVPSHFSGAFLNENLVILDRSTDDFSASELIVLDLNALTSATRSNPDYRSVLAFPVFDTTPRTTIVDKPEFSFSSRLFVSANRVRLYTMDGNTRQLRAFLVSDIIAAFNNTTTLNWTDGSRIGDPGLFYTGGVAGENPDGELLIDGSESFGLPGGVMYVNPEDPALILASLDPAGTAPFYNAVYSRATDELIAIDATFGQPLQAYARNSGVAPIPAINPCSVFDDIYVQLDEFATSNGLDPNTADFNDDGIPEHAILALVEFIVCGADSDVKKATIVAYDFNRHTLNHEADGQTILPFRDLFALLLATGQDAQNALPTLLSNSTPLITLENDYISVTCTAAGCEPVFDEKRNDPSQIGQTIANQPYAAAGDFDGDGITNLVEYDRVIANGGDENDFRRAATSTVLNGEPTLERHADSGSCFIATAAYGTPMATEIDELRSLRDTHLLSNPLGAIFVDSYYRLSPPIADKVAQHQGLRSIVRIVLAPVVVAAKWMNITSPFPALAGVFVLLCTVLRRRRAKATQPSNS